MDLYFGKPSGNKIILDSEESNHLLNVKRISKDVIIHVTDGEGKFYETKIFEIDKKNCSLSILNTKTFEKPPFHLHIAISPTKSIDRIEWFLEKATETGIDEISFIKCRHSERKEIKIDRLNRILISAIKQSIKPFLPKINPMTDFQTFIKGNLTGTKLICSMEAEKNEGLNKYCTPGNKLIALIGPEGDFHIDECTLAIQNGFKPVSLGASRLRTETAALSVCTIFNFVNLF